ncbi:hypothetical protein B0H63DRAFT_506684 [Podospora didyma]|uniref:Uncharacterized protein n=1 Tax=Podospora didyma TaxID=330526 RepID=A0AAE0P8A1_9PEZI|nr:hypothetical protein B0H63DRAFT_506684 [Podospora didyma]
MVIFTGGRSKAINSPRHLTIRHARRKKLVSKISLGLVALEQDDQPILKPGEEKLNSFWAPGLEAGEEHVILATQTIAVKDRPSEPPLVLTSEQDFWVDAPQFSLPEGSVYSFYPPSGYPDDHRILPHVVLSDPHLPWERRGSPNDDKRGDTRNKVPWLVLFSFTQDELKLAPDALGDGVTFKQTPTLAVTMGVKDVMKNANVVTSITEDDLGPNFKDDTTADFIFIKPDLFKSMFATFDGSNKRVVPATPDTTKYKYLAHVRNINTTGMAEAGKEDIGIFSVVVGSRGGPLENVSPTSVSVHLLSIEGVERMHSWPDNDKLMALCSLHSWNYTVNPPGMVNVHEAFINLGKTLNVLRAPDGIIEGVLKRPDKVSQRLARRLQDGFSLVKYRTQTGEPTVALYRGPFTPTVVAPLSARTRNDRGHVMDPNSLQCSNSGQDLQILDREVGIMDVSYSAAWQIGRVLALGDQGFTAALVRLRTAIQNSAMKKSKFNVLRTVGGNASFRTRTDVLSALSETAGHLDQLHDADGTGGFVTPTSPKKRWMRPRLAKRAQYPSLGFNAAQVKPQYLTHATKAAQKLAMSRDGDVFDETNDPVSTDWMQVLAWILDRMFLSGVPAHYLISDPSHLQPENLRFFYIDPNWVDALIDGALSLGNHMGEDRDRVAIKHAINQYIHHTPEHQTQPPQIPTYGFYLRSDLVTMFPDLKVTTLPEPPKGVIPDRAPLLRHEIIADGVMIGLLDRLPDAAADSDFQGLRFTQPPHQQRFAIAPELTKDAVEIDMRRQYTVDQETREEDPDRHVALRIIETKPSDSDNWFVWSTDPSSSTQNDLRVLRLPFFAEEQLKVLTDPEHGMDKRFFDDDTANSALLAMQLNDPFYSLTIHASNPGVASLMAQIRDDNPEPRGLKLINPSEVRKLFVPDHDSEDDEDDDSEEEESEEDDEEEDDGDEDSSAAASTASPSAIFQRHDSYQPHDHVTSSNLAPHAPSSSIPKFEPSHPGMLLRTGINPPGRNPTPTPTLTQTLVAPTPTISAPTPSSSSGLQSVVASGNDPAGPPVFTCNLYSVGFTSVQTNADPLPQDLVFSIQVSNTSVSDYRLMEFQIIIPLGRADDPNSHRLFPLYDGNGPRMLSNLRFNVLPALGNMEGVPCLILRLLPRSANGWTSVRLIKEMSFLLCLAKPNATFQGEDRTLLTLYTAAYYKYVAEKEPLEGHFVAALKKNPDA